MGYSLQYYDLVLVGLVVSLAVGVGVGILTPVSMAVSVIALAFFGFAILGHALFVNGPIETVGDLDREVAVEDVPVLDVATDLVN